MSWAEYTNKCRNIKQKYMPYIHLVIDQLVIHRFILSVLGLLLYRIFFDVLYVVIINPVFASEGFTFSFSLLRYVLTMVITVIMLLPIARLFYSESNSSMMVLLLNLIWFLPLQTLYSLKGLPLEFYLSSMTYWLIMMGAHYLLPLIHLKPPSWDTKKLIDIIAFASVAIVLFASWKYTGFRVHFGIMNVYGIRAEAAQFDMGLFLNYFISIAPTILPIFMVRALTNKKYVQALVFFVTTYLRFSMDGSKSSLFFLLICLTVYILYRSWQRWFFPTGLIVLGGASVVEYISLSSVYISSLFFRRSMLVPIQLSSEYFEFFTNNPCDLLRSGVLGKLGFESIYSGNQSMMMGWIFQNVEVFANNGLVGDALACFGLIGVIIMPIVLIMIFRLLDACAHSHSRRFTLGICVYYVVALCNSSWSTVLLSHGLLFVCFVMYLWKSENNNVPIEQIALNSSREKEL